MLSVSLLNVTFIELYMYNIGLTASLARPAIPLVSSCDPLILVNLPLQTGQFTEVYKTIPHNSRLLTRQSRSRSLLSALNMTVTIKAACLQHSAEIVPRPPLLQSYLTSSAMNVQNPTFHATFIRQSMAYQMQVIPHLTFYTTGDQWFHDCTKWRPHHVTILSLS